MLVKPMDQNSWTIPGGVVEADEAPKKRYRREIQEEFAVDLPLGALPAVDYTPANESLHGNSSSKGVPGGRQRISYEWPRGSTRSACWKVQTAPERWARPTIRS